MRPSHQRHTRLRTSPRRWTAILSLWGSSSQMPFATGSTTVHILQHFRLPKPATKPLTSLRQHRNPCLECGSVRCCRLGLRGSGPPHGRRLIFFKAPLLMNILSLCLVLPVLPLSLSLSLSIALYLCVCVVSLFTYVCVSLCVSTFVCMFLSLSV